MPKGFPRSQRSQTSPFWAANDARLRHMAEVEGLTTSEAAARLGVTKSAVIGRSYRLGIVWSRSPEPKRPEQPPAIEFPPLGRCVWPNGHPRQREAFHWCGAPIARPGLPYCAEHMARAYVGVPTPLPKRSSQPYAVAAE